MSETLMPLVAGHASSKPGTLGGKRKPLAVGNVYRFAGYRGNGFKITAMSLPGTPSDDGGLPGVAVQWLNHAKQRGWYVFHSENEFWNYHLFSNAQSSVSVNGGEKKKDFGIETPTPQVP